MEIELFGPKILDTEKLNNRFVQGESGVDTLEFKLPKYYGGMDLSALTFKIRTVSAANTITEQLLGKTSDEQELCLTCTVTQDMTAVAGRVCFQVIGENEEGTLRIKYTSPEVYILPSLSSGDPPPKDYLEAMLAQMSAQFTEAIQASDTNATRAETAAQTAEQKAIEACEYAQSIEGDTAEAKQSASQASTAAAQAQEHQNAAEEASNTAAAQADRAQAEADRAAAIAGFDPNTKVDKVPGKELSSNDYTDQEREKLLEIPEDLVSCGAEEPGVPLPTQAPEMVVQTQGKSIAPQTHTRAVYNAATGENLEDTLQAIVQKQSDTDAELAQKAERSELCRENLLDNWFLAAPVNQRGKTEYTGSGYDIDRWIGSSNVRVVLENGALFLQRTADVTSGVSFLQKVQASRFLNQKHVFSVLTDQGLYSVEFTPPSGAAPDSSLKIAEKVAGTEPFTLQVWQYTTGDFGCSIALSNPVDGVSGIRLIAAKLEAGSDSTLAVQDSEGTWTLHDPPPDPALELAKCQRYFYRLYCSGGSYVNLGLVSATSGASGVYLAYRLPVPMRINPTVSCADLSEISITDGAADSGITPTALSGSAPNGYDARILFTASVTAGKTYVVWLKGGAIDFNADL